MPRMRLTTVTIERLKPPGTGQLDYFDAAYPGFALRITSKGVKTFVLFCRVNGKLRRVTLGRWPGLTLAKAREKAGAAAEAAANGEDPGAPGREARKAARDTVATVVADWLARDQAGNRSHDEVTRIMNREVLPAWQHRRIQGVTRRDAIELIDAIADRGAVVLARRVHAHLHRLFRWAVGRDVIAANPMTDAPKPGTEIRRDRVLTDVELGEVWRAADANGWPFGPAVKLLILTGARRDEIGALRWAEIDNDNGAIVLQGARTKNGEPHTIPLAPMAQAILRALPRIAGVGGTSTFVFSTTGRTPISGWSRAKALLDDTIVEARRTAAIETNEAPDKVGPLEPWRFHDFRRTVATGLQRLGVRLEAIEAVLGHISGSRAGIVGTYQRHVFAAETRAALLAWADHVAQVIGSASATVVPLRREARP